MAIFIILFSLSWTENLSYGGQTAEWAFEHNMNGTECACRRFFLSLLNNGFFRSHKRRSEYNLFTSLMAYNMLCIYTTIAVMHTHHLFPIAVFDYISYILKYFHTHEYHTLSDCGKFCIWAG